MSSVSHIRTPPPKGVQTNGTEEIRYKAGDACTSIFGKGMTWSLSVHVLVIG